MPTATLSRYLPLLAVLCALVSPAASHAQVIPPAGYLYDAQVLGTTTRSCIATGPGGTFVGIGPTFSPNAQAVVLVRESGAAHLVAFGFNSLGDCAYDALRDVLYVSDNADAGDLPGAESGDTVFAILSASTASGLLATDTELVPAESVPNAASLAVLANGDVLVSDSTGGGAGTVLRIDVDGGPSLSTFASGFDFTSGLAIDPTTGDILVAETRSGTFDAQIRRFDAAGIELPVFAGPSFAFGSFDLAFNVDGTLLATGAFGGDVVAFDSLDNSTPFVSGLTFASGITVNEFTGRVDILSSFSDTVEDRSIHRFVPVNRLEAGRGKRSLECVHEFYGLELVATTPGGAARNAVCVDGAPCDSDGIVNDVCLFPVGFCLNVADPALPECATDEPVVAATVQSVPFSPAVSTAAGTLVADLPAAGTTCHFSDGFAVPVRSTKQGKKAGVGRIRVQAKLGTGKKDTDKVRLICKPAAP
jgi:hypothetical protein